MKLIKDNNIVNLTDEFVIEIYKSSGWEELKEEPKEETPEVKEIPKETTKSKKNKK